MKIKLATSVSDFCQQKLFLCLYLPGVTLGKKDASAVYVY